MIKLGRTLGRTMVFATTAVVLALALSGCGSTDDADEPAGADISDITGNAPVTKLNMPLPDRIAGSGVIRVANPLANPPYAFKTPEGQLQGVAPDLSKALEPVLGVKFEWIDTPFPSLMPGLQSGKFDMIWGSLTDTVERQKMLDFVDYEKDGGILLVAKGNPEQIVDVTSLCGKTASGLAGSVQLSVLEEQSGKCTASGAPPITVKTFQEIQGAQVALRSGQVDTFMAGLGAGLYQVRTAGGGNTYESVGPIYQEAVLGAAFQKTDKELSAAVEAGLKQLESNGTYGKIMEKYGLGKGALTADRITLNGATS